MKITLKSSLIGIAIILGVSSNVNAYFYETENTFEVYEPRILITRNHTGFVTGKKCKECKLTKYIVTPDVIAIDFNRKRVDLQEANNWSGKAALFTYNLKTNKLLKIHEERGILE